MAAQLGDSKVNHVNSRFKKSQAIMWSPDMSLKFWAKWQGWDRTTVLRASDGHWQYRPSSVPRTDHLGSFYTGKSSYSASTLALLLSCRVISFSGQTIHRRCSWLVAAPVTAIKNKGKAEIKQKQTHKPKQKKTNRPHLFSIRIATRQTYSTLSLK